MAQLLVFAEHSIFGNGVLAWGDGAMRKIQSLDPARLPPYAFWSFIPAGEGDWGMVLNHGDARVLVADEQGKPVLGFPSAEPRRGWWRMEPRGAQGHVALVPYFSDRHALAVLPGDGIAMLRPAAPADLDTQAWYPRRAEAASSVPLPSFDDAAIDETFYNIEVVQPGSGAQNKRLYLTIENEQGESALKIGTDPKATAAQFLLVPVGTGRIVSAGKPFASSGRAEEERICASNAAEVAQRELEMVNLSGSRTFVSGDRVALRTEFRYYVSWKKGSRDLTVRAHTPGASETFVIKKVNAGGEVLPGEIKPGDSFALAAGEHHLSDDRGADSRPVSVAGHPNIAAWEIFVLGAPAARLYRIHGKKNGHPLSREDARGGEFIGLQQRFGRGAAQFELVDRGDGMISLRSYVGPRFAYPVVPAGPVEPGQKIGLRDRSNTPGMLFRLQAAPATPWPDTVDLTMEKYRDPAEDVSRAMLGGMFSMGGHALSAATGIPGGAAVFTFVFNIISPAKKVSSYDLFTKFRADILRDVTVLIADNASTQAKAALKSAREQYVVTYLNARRHDPGGADAKSRANDVAGHYVRALDSIPLARGSEKISDTDSNRAMVRAGLPVYAIIVAEYINILQEIALISAFKPELVLPDVWLKTRGQYVTASPSSGVRYEAADAPLTKAVRVLHRDGSKTLKHGDKVILRSPASTNISASGGGGALEAKVPSKQIGDAETFTIERVPALPAPQDQTIKSGDSIALKASNGRYVTAPDGGGPLAASAQSRGAAETFVLQVAAPKVAEEPPRLEGNLRGTVDALQNLRTFAALRYEDTRDMFELLVNARVGGNVIRPDLEYRAVPHMNAPSDFHYKMAFRDTQYNMELDRVDTKTVGKPEPPPGFDDPNRDTRLQWGMDGYREHLRRVYYSFKYRYFSALRPLLTIADDTQKLCDQLSKDPLMSTEYSYIARTTPEYRA